MAFALSSPAFSNDGPIPDKHSRDGGNVSPPLQWRDAPPEAKSYVVVVEDPDAPRGTFRHWAVYNIPADRRELPEGAGSGSSTQGLKHGVNDFGNTQYDGPRPPPGHGTHHYHFRIAALTVASLDLSRQAAALNVWEAARPHIVAETELIGTYVR